MDEQEFQLPDTPDDKTCEYLLRQPKLLLMRYLDCHSTLSKCLSVQHHLQMNLEAWKNLLEISEMETSKLNNRIAALENENRQLRLQLNDMPAIGRPPKYDTETRQLVIDFYNESSKHTYKVTADHFDMSTSTLCKILNDARENGIHVRSLRS